MLGLIDAAALIGASAVLLYLFLRAKITSLRIFSLLLGLFALSHGLYHLFFTLVAGGGYYPAREVLYSLSIAFVLAFVVYYIDRGGLV